MNITVFWIEEESRWIYVTNEELAIEVRNHYINDKGYVEYYMLLEDNKIKETNYSNSIIGDEFKGVIDTRETLVLK